MGQSVIDAGQSVIDAAKRGQDRAADFVRWGVQWIVGGRNRRCPWSRCGWQREDLEASPIIGNEVLGDEAIARLDVCVDGHFKERAEGIVVVKAEASPVACEDQEHVEPQLVGGERGKKASSKERVRNESEALIPDAPDPIGADRSATEWLCHVVTHGVTVSFGRSLLRVVERFLALAFSFSAARSFASFKR